MNIEEIFDKYIGCKNKDTSDGCSADTWNNCPGCEHELPHGVRRACAVIIRFRNDMNEWEKNYE